MTRLKCTNSSAVALQVCRALLAALSAAASLPLLAVTTAAAPADKVYTIGNYPVEATAKNAVTAKREAIADGRRAAFRSLLKRLVPVTAYPRLKVMADVDAQNFIKSVAVKSERSSRTRYIANLDFTFSPDAVRRELRRQSVPYVDTAAPEAVLVAIFKAPPPATPGTSAEMGAAGGAELWSSVWTDLDLANSVAPLKLRRRVPQLHDDTVAAVNRGDTSALRILASEYASDRVVLALAEPDVPARRLNVVVAGRDAVGPFVLKRRYRFDPDDFAYALELAAVISQGVIEGRWKAVKMPAALGGGASGQAAEPVEVWVTFSNLAQWRNRQRVLQDLPGVRDFRTGGLSTEGASVQLRYPGGGAALRDALAAQGLTLVLDRGAWILQ